MTSTSASTLNMWCAQGQGNQYPSLLSRNPQINIPGNNDYVVSTFNSNTTYFLPTCDINGPYTALLPQTNIALGCKYRFIAATNGVDLDDQWTVSSQGIDIQGSVISGAPGGGFSLTSFINAGYVIFDGTRLQGSYIDLECDGYNWYVSGILNESGGPIRENEVIKRMPIDKPEVTLPTKATGWFY